MTPEEKIKKIQELEQKFLNEIESIKKEYQLKIKEVMDIANKQKIENLKKDLGI
jgi:CRISPR/Cas system CSM-associated protein Csm4 (group 5 of RAMP superfamily)